MDTLYSLPQGQRGVEHAMQRVDLQKDIQALVEETSATAQENKADFLMADYFVRLLWLSVHYIDQIKSI